jgi:hypothetical protein
MWDPASRRARVVETANLLAWALRRERPDCPVVIRRPQPDHSELLEVAAPWQLRWLVCPSYSVKERLAPVLPPGSAYWLPLACHLTEPLRRRLRTARTRAQLTKPQRQCLTRALLQLADEFERQAASATGHGGAGADLASAAAARRELLLRTTEHCRCLAPDTVMVLRLWAEKWRAQKASSRPELLEFRDDLLGLVWPDDRAPIVVPEARSPVA